MQYNKLTSEVPMMTVLIIFKTGETDMKDVWSLDDICLDGVFELRIIRDERKVA